MSSGLKHNELSFDDLQFLKTRRHVYGLSLNYTFGELNNVFKNYLKNLYFNDKQNITKEALDAIQGDYFGLKKILTDYFISKGDEHLLFQDAKGSEIPKVDKKEINTFMDKERDDRNDSSVGNEIPKEVKEKLLEDPDNFNAFFEKFYKPQIEPTNTPDNNLSLFSFGGVSFSHEQAHAYSPQEPQKLNLNDEDIENLDDYFKEYKEKQEKFFKSVKPEPQNLDEEVEDYKEDQEELLEECEKKQEEAEEDLPNIIEEMKEYVNKDADRVREEIEEYINRKKSEGSYLELCRKEWLYSYIYNLNDYCDGCKKKQEENTAKIVECARDLSFSSKDIQENIINVIAERERLSGWVVNAIWDVLEEKRILEYKNSNMERVRPVLWEQPVNSIIDFIKYEISEKVM